MKKKHLQESEFDSITDIYKNTFYDDDVSYNEVQSLKMRV
jgi:hypothetical protein